MTRPPRSCEDGEFISVDIDRNENGGFMVMEPEIFNHRVSTNTLDFDSAWISSGIRSGWKSGGRMEMLSGSGGE